MLRKEQSKVFERDLIELRPSSVAQSDWVRMGEGQRVEAIKAAAVAPDICGPAYVAAPARGGFEVFRPIEITRTADGSAGAFRDAGFQGRGEARPRRAIRRADVFDAMIEEARQRHQVRKGDAPFVAPISVGQVAAGRAYRDLIEWREGFGSKPALAEPGGGRGAGGAIDAYVQSGLRLKAFIAAIGTGIVLTPRRSMDRDNARATVSVRFVVDAVCLWDWTLSEIIRKAGWQPKGDVRATVRRGLSEALERMRDV